MTPYVTVIIGAYNAMPYLTQTLQSVYDQTLSRDRIELIAVDDRSTDGTYEELLRFRDELWPEMIVDRLDENSGGPSAPRNRETVDSTVLQKRALRPANCFHRLTIACCDGPTAKWPALCNSSCARLKSCCSSAVRAARKACSNRATSPLLGTAAGAIVVTTPQEVAISDVRRCVTFCKTLSLPVVGIVENMSGFMCPKCGERIDLFKCGGGMALAREMGVPFLGRIPIDTEVVTSGDAGIPLLGEGPQSPAAKAFADVVDSILDADNE